jgi:RHS repeat-associated protein
LRYGEEIPDPSRPSSDNTRRFTGHERDPDSSLDYMFARYYSGALARFLSPDVLEFLTPDEADAAEVFASPQLRNRYAYARNDRVSFLDPDGLFCPLMHKSLTRKVMREFGFDDEQIDVAADANAAQDKGRPKIWIEHALRPEDMCLEEAVEAHRQYVEERVETAVEKGLAGDATGSLEALGEAFHAVQDAKHGFVTYKQHGLKQGWSDVFPGPETRIGGLSRSRDVMGTFMNRFFKQGRKMGLSNKEIMRRWD